jgi:uncharacterized caspase-like protein
VSEAFAPKRRPWLSHGVVGLFVFGVTTLVIQSGVRRQTAILDSMEMQPISSAATLAYGWGSAEDARRLLADLLSLAERKSAVPPGRSGKDPDFVTLRRMDADMARLRLAMLEGAPRSKLQEICARTTIRCTPYTLEGIINMLKKQRHVP